MQTLFFPLFARVQRADVRIHVLQFSWASMEKIDAIRQSAHSYGFDYRHVLTYARLKRLGVPAMIMKGAGLILSMVRLQGINVLMPRSIIPAAMCLLARRIDPTLRLIFDADGLMADERVEFSGWSSQGAMYQIFRRWEAQSVRTADAVITRSHHAKRTLLARAGAGTPSSRIHVIPNAKDETVFCAPVEKSRAQLRLELGLGVDGPLFIYAGALGPQHLGHAMFDIFAHVVDGLPEATFLLASPSKDIPHLLDRLPSHVAARVIVRELAPDQVPAYMSASDIGFSLRLPSFSQQAVCPIKLIEYMMCGLAVITHSGVGDLDERFPPLEGLYALRGTASRDLVMAAQWCIDHVKAPEHVRARRAAELRSCASKEFNIEEVSERFHALLSPSHATISHAP